ncbi:MAG TPA: NAD(P)H-dependent oxidoreductase subunit E [Rhodocyclaceae bacterium]|nr:NAD(P)H-dependent oxidoreductase subunit E [Rhodocyclaceae bacterium]
MTILREAQEAQGWLSPDILDAIAQAVGWPLARVRSTADFYSFFHTEPRGAYRVLWSDNIIERMMGSEALMTNMCHQLWLEPGRPSEDGLVSVETTSCIGMGDQGPALLVNYRTVTCMTEERVSEMVALIRNHVPVAEWPAEWFEVKDNIRRKGALLGNTLTPGDALRACFDRAHETALEGASNERSWREFVPTASSGPQGTLEEIKRSNLRGRGGAGFTTGLKWEACREAPGKAHYVVCNADEGEPGTFKDRVLLTSYADLVFEGMTVAGYVVGATQGFLYLRGEYRYLLEPLEAVLAKRREQKLLGAGILGTDFDFDIHICLGAGAYVCGEESALIESLEGKPGKPRIRPPFPVVQGYLGQPTTVNNVETLAAAALIAAHGGDWYKTMGTAKSAGTKILSVSGDCERPGIYEYAYGVTVAQVLEDCGASDTLAVQISGPSGVCLAEDEFQRKIAFEDLPTAGAFMVFDKTRDMFDMARNFAHFFAHESCGFCTPCRVGTNVVARLMDKLDAGHGSPYDIDEMFKMHRLMQSASHCGLGHTACNPMFDTLQKFRPAYERRLDSLDYTPAFDLDEALSQARQMTGRDDPGAHIGESSMASIDKESAQ